MSNRKAIAVIGVRIGTRNEQLVALCRDHFSQVVDYQDEKEFMGTVKEYCNDLDTFESLIDDLTPEVISNTGYCSDDIPF